MFLDCPGPSVREISGGLAALNGSRRARSARMTNSRKFTPAIAPAGSSACSRSAWGSPHCWSRTGRWSRPNSGSPAERRVSAPVSPAEAPAVAPARSVHGAAAVPNSYRGGPALMTRRTESTFPERASTMTRTDFPPR